MSALQRRSRPSPADCVSAATNCFASNPPLETFSNTALAAEAKNASCTFGSEYFAYASLRSSLTALSDVSVSPVASCTGPVALRR